MNEFGVSPSGKAAGFDPAIRRFESCHPSHIARFKSSVASACALGQSREGQDNARSGSATRLETSLVCRGHAVQEASRVNARRAAPKG